MSTPSSAAAPISTEELRRLAQRSDAKGLLRLCGHLVAIGVALGVYAFAREAGANLALRGLAATAYGFTLVTMFAAMHESVHRTAFKGLWLNNGIGWFAGLLSFYNSTFYRHYHGWHHRFANVPGKDPELDDPKPTSLLAYAIEISGVTWWIGKLRTHFTLALGKTGSYGFLNETTAPAAVRSVRLQLLAYAGGIAVSIALGSAYFVVYWLLPVALGQPLLRAILLAEHTGCSQDDDALANTRTTHTNALIRFLMWEMPYHAEHHRYPALPFFALADAHMRLGPHLAHVARRGYHGMHADFLRGLVDAGKAAPQS